MKLFKNILFILFACGIIFFTGCRSNRWNPDVSKVPVSVTIDRFEQALFTVDTSNMDNFQRGIKRVESQYPAAYEAYVEHLLAVGPKDSFPTLLKLHKLISDSYWQGLYRDVEKKFDQKLMDSLRLQFDNAFRHYKYYYPADTIPRVVTFVKGFNPYQVVPAIFTYEDILGISLDNFMGADYKYYQGWPLYSDYQIRRFTPQYILPNSLKTLFSNKYPNDGNQEQTLLDNAVYLGKALFFLDAMTPDMPDTLKIEYTGKQLQWANDNEGQIWQHFTESKLLYSTDEKQTARYTTDAPFTNATGVPQEAPPRLAEYLGWQIVKSYMKNNPGVTLQQLMQEQDSRKILSMAKYKPK
jgi:hypothetical protein